MTTLLNEPAATLHLAEVLDLKAAAPLAAELLALRGRPVVLDASRVQRLGALCLQVVMSGRASWKADGVEFAIASPSEDFSDALTLFGASSLEPQHSQELGA